MLRRWEISQIAISPNSPCRATSVAPWRRSVGSCGCISSRRCVASGCEKSGRARWPVCTLPRGKPQWPLTVSWCSAILGWAEKVGERPDGSNPCRHVERYPEKPRERLLTVDELARLGDALTRAEGERLADWRPVATIRLLLFTGARLSEVLGLTWGMLDFDAGIARLPDSKTGAKNLVLTAPALSERAGFRRRHDPPAR